MVYKTRDEKKLEKKYEERYSAMVESLMDEISVSPVFKKDESFSEEGVYLRDEKWFVGEYTVQYSSHLVCAIKADDEEMPLFYMKAKDYKKFEQACEQKRAALLKQRHIQKSK